jgi:hypothetical protein
MSDDAAAQQPSGSLTQLWDQFRPCSTARGYDTLITLVKRLARQLLDLDRALKATDKLIADRFHDHPHAAIIESLPGHSLAGSTVASAYQLSRCRVPRRVESLHADRARSDGYDLWGASWILARAHREAFRTLRQTTELSPR